MKTRQLLILVMAVILLLPVGAVYAEGEDFEDILNAQIKVLQ